MPKGLVVSELLFAALSLTAPCAVAQPSNDTANRANLKAYEATLRCFVVNGAASGEREDAGDKETAARYERAARRSFDLAVKLGGALGYSGSRINQDLGLAEARELPKLSADASYTRNALATCKALGLT